MKKTFSFLLALCLVLSFGVTAFAVVEPSESFYAADYANVLTNSTEASIVSYNGALEQQCQGAQIVVVTVDYLDGMSCDNDCIMIYGGQGRAQIQQEALPGVFDLQLYHCVDLFLRLFPAL